MSATTRMVLDSCRTMVIWGFSLIVGWQKFQFLQLIGFALLVIGMCIYSNIIFGKVHSIENHKFKNANSLVNISVPLGRKVYNSCKNSYERMEIENESDSEIP